jgi:predicted phage tail protein
MSSPFFSDIEQNILLPSLPEGTLSSIQSITIYDLLSSGEINGFPSAIADGHSFPSENYLRAGLKDVFLNGTQVVKQTADAATISAEDFNFSGVTFEVKTGTADQAAITNNLLISQAQTETAVGVQVTQGTPISRSITNPCDQLRVTMAFPAMQTFNDDGTISGASVNIKMKITQNNGAVNDPVIDDTITGKCTSTYKKDYGIAVSGFSFPITLTVTRVTADSSEAKLQNNTFFDSFTEIQADTNAYPNSAYTALRIDSRNFGGAVPKRMFRVQGTKISIPHNATVQNDGSLSYSGTFNGTFKTAKEWTNDPAWILYDVLTSDKGLGDHLDSSKIDVFSFYSASVYCAEQVDDMTGTGNTEPRFTFNSVIRGQISAYNIINKICSNMRAMAFYSAGSIELVQDRPSDPVYLFNLSNVTEAGFSYTNTSQTTKFTRINVSYFNMLTQENDFVSVEDTALQAKYGVVVKNLRAYGCTSFGQARRFGKWFLYTQNNECELCNFTTTLAAGVIVRPGMVISIADPLRAGSRRGGLISAVNSTSEIVVDDSEDTDLSALVTSTLSVIMPDGTMESRTIQGIGDKTIVVNPAFSTAPNVNSAWIIENSTLSAQTYRVISVSESKQSQYSISAVIHNSNKYDQVEDGTFETPKNVTILNAVLSAPANLSAAESLVEINGKAVSKIDFAFESVPNAISYFIQYKFNNSNYQTVETQSTSFELFNSQKGTYEFRVSTINFKGQVSTLPSVFVFNAVGKTKPPEQVTGLTAEVLNSQNIKLSFDKSTSLDVIHGGNVIVTHSTDTSGSASFSNSTTLSNSIPGNATEAIVPNIAGEFFVKFRDTLGLLSTDETSIIVAKPDAQPNLGIQNRREDTDSPPFQGNKVNTFYDSTLDLLLLSGDQNFDDVLDVDALSSFDFAGDIAQKGIYDFATTLDLGSKFTLELEKHFKASGLLINDLFDTRNAFIETWDDFDGAKAESVDSQLFVSTTDSDPSAGISATYSQTGQVITVTKTSHGLVVGDRLNITFSTGTATNGSFEVLTVPNANTFTVQATMIEASYTSFPSELSVVQVLTNKTHPSVDTVLNIDVLSGSLPSGNYKVTGANFDSAFGKLFFADSFPSVSNPTAGTIGEGKLLFISSTESTSGNCIISNKFSKFNKFHNGEFVGRAFQFRAILFSGDPAQNIGLEELGFKASFKPRVENSIENSGATNGIFSSGTNTKTVTFQHPFFAGTSDLGGSTSKYLPSIGITLQNAQSGDFFTVHTITGTSFQIDVKNGLNFVDRNFTYIASGFGKGG